MDYLQQKINTKQIFKLDIRECFQGRNDKDKKNNKSNDETDNELIGNLLPELKTLAMKIGTKVYEYGFLRG